MALKVYGIIKFSELAFVAIIELDVCIIFFGMIATLL